MEGFWLDMESPGWSLGAACDHAETEAHAANVMIASAFRIVLPYFTSLLLPRECCGLIDHYRLLPMDKQRWALPRLRAEMGRSPEASRAAPGFAWRGSREYECCRRVTCPWS